MFGRNKPQSEPAARLQDIASRVRRDQQRLRDHAGSGGGSAWYETPELTMLGDWPTFNEFVVEAPEDAAALLERLAAKRILAGIPLSRYDAADRKRFLVAVTEMNTRGEMDQLVAALAGRAS